MHGALHQHPFYRFFALQTRTRMSEYSNWQRVCSILNSSWIIQLELSRCYGCLHYRFHLLPHLVETLNLIILMGLQQPCYQSIYWAMLHYSYVLPNLHLPLADWYLSYFRLFAYFELESLLLGWISFNVANVNALVDYPHYCWEPTAVYFSFAFAFLQHLLILASSADSSSLCYAFELVAMLMG